MPAKKRGKHADIFKDLESGVQNDYDPEDDAPSSNEHDSVESEDEEPQIFDGREHYEAVGKSRLRQQQSYELGPQYSGTRVRRSDVELEEDEEEDEDEEEEEDDEDEDDNSEDEYGLDGYTSSEASASQLKVNGYGSDNLGSAGPEDDNTGSGEDIIEENSDDESGFELESDKDITPYMDSSSTNNRPEIRRLMHESQKSTISQANRADAEKGRAVKRQRATFDSFLNTRIRMQAALIAMNSFPAENDYGETETNSATAYEAAENATIKLLNTLHDLSSAIEETRTKRKRMRMDATTSSQSSQIWTHMQSFESDTLQYREKILGKWSAKAQAATTLPMTKRLNNAARSNTIIDVVREQLLNTERLIKRTHVPRSCAPLQANAGELESNEIFDDADFYGVLLKELLEQRNADSASAYQTDVATQQWRAVKQVKPKKEVDTRASKGRKLRYTVQEKLQNFMAPEDRGTWGERQINEFFGSLLGKQMALEEDDIVMDERSQVDPTIRLFR